MGKLHTLRRAIQREPEKWYYYSMFGHYVVMCARFRNRQWEPTGASFYGNSYKKFVRKTLVGLGHPKCRKCERTLPQKHLR